MISTTDNEQAIVTELETDGLSKKRRQALLLKLQKVGTEQSLSVLQANLRSADVKSQVRALFALTHIGTEAAVESLIDCLDMETMGPRFTFAVKALRDHHASYAMPALTRTLEERRSEIDQGDKRLIIVALSRSPHRSQIPALAALLGERNRRTRQMAAEALSLIKAIEAREALEEAARSLSWLQGLQARRALRLMRYGSSE